ncbi:MAG: hypothetical protein D6750_06120 [Bacteroidetes bacterium]|jgi:hypothetical protein|nr:MAG: hypothetical protein D6750_06120 [Bacteroidota bacterium]
MSRTPLTNLDIQCAELGRQLAEIRDDRGKQIEEKVFNEALAVLEEQGPYAMFLYLQARHDKVANPINENSLGFLKGVFTDRLDGVNNILDAVKHLADSPDDLLFARDLLRTALSYARYHLKAKGDKTP